ncbi:dockerin-like protein [Acetivibrio clariflavus DSM 19732]|uniref:Dockerin-like protein n=2 Tax=Acetivibrio clariflavus TaxID=288965 RepID=G8M2B0_ACECE|nr:dockerin-like protein [Acetivibrio clariflavus DSM 19732]
MVSFNKVIEKVKEIIIKIQCSNDLQQIKWQEGKSRGHILGKFTMSNNFAKIYTKIYTSKVKTSNTNTTKQEVTISMKSKVIKGDINGDGVFNSIDLALMKMYLTGSIKFTEEQFEAADVDNSGEVNSIDYAIMKQVLLGYRPGF